MILVGGEALIDLVPGADGALAAHPGGGPFNTARAVARLGRPVAYLGRLSTDRFGRRLEELLREDGVGLSSVVHTDEPTTLALAEVDADGSACYRFYERATAAPGLEPADALAALPDAVEILHVGTLGLVLEPVASALEAVVERLAGRALVVVDPNVRPGVIRDPDAYRSRLARVLARADVVKLSEEDAGWLAPGRSPVDAVRELLAGGPALGLFTRRGEGAVEATRFACLVAALTCERAGAVPPRSDEL
jgi:fructokinase